ncbi:phosphopeptide-binding protein [Beijerinckiaceae bacterium]|nr:phosphopeptide-binding protein [Beijerinckiaceae bacterium]
MSNDGIERIIIRHVNGSKANQIEQISLGDLTEITIGRDPSSTIAFDSPRDDVVSRRHAVIRVVREPHISFRLADLGSSNGTFLNGERITDELELLPDDAIGLGKNGVKLIFDVQPRPSSLASRTRLIDVGDAAATRVIKTAEIAASMAANDAVTKTNIGADTGTGKFEPPPKTGVGKETVLHLLGEERRATSRIWIASLAGFAAFVALGGAFFYWKHAHDQQELQTQNQRLKDDLSRRQAGLESKTDEQFGLSSQDIVKQFGNATAQISTSWRLYDQTTGKPVFHQTFRDHERRSKDLYTYPAYVRMPNNVVVRWLTLEDDNRTNIPIGERLQGTGFVVSEHGFILTNKHVAAPWNLAFGQSDPANDSRFGWLYEIGGGPGAKDPKLRYPTRIDLADEDYSSLKAWAPASGGLVFVKNMALFPNGVEGNIPDPSKGGTHTFFGRDDVLEVRFANSRVSAAANLARVSSESDAALIKVDTPQLLNKLEIASDDDVTVGEKVIALGYPSVARSAIAFNSTIENGQIRKNEDIVPLPFVSEGIVALVSPAAKTENGITMVGLSGDMIQLSINSTGAGNSGGPVFNKAGKVIGLFTYGISRGGANTSGAVPIKYGRDLLQSQHP